MAPRQKQTTLIVIVALIVVTTIISAGALSVASIFENKRFVEATSKILWLSRTLRLAAEKHRLPALNPGDDVWAALIQSGQVSTATDHALPWGHDLHAIAAASNSVRIEALMPPHNCRRVALYFLSFDLDALGLLSVAAMPEANASWGLIYPLPANERVDAAVEACGNATDAKLALTFKIN